MIFRFCSFRIVIGGWGNTRSVIRRQMQGKHLAEVETLNILANRTPLKVLVDIKTGLFIRFRTLFDC